MKKTLFLIAIFLLIIVHAFAKLSKVRPKLADILIEGQVVDSALISSTDKPINVIIHISIFPTSGITSPATKYVIQTDSEHRFKFAVPAQAKRVYMQVDIQPSGKSYWSFPDNIYVLEQGDQIHCKLSSKYFEFTGKGSSKLQCQSAIYKYQFDAVNATDYLHFEAIHQWDRALKIENHGLDSILKLRLATVKRFSPRLGKEMTEILVTNCYGLRYYLWLRTGYITSQSNERYLSFINSQPYKTIDFTLNQNLKTSYLISSPIYCDFLYQKICVESLSVNDWKNDCSQQRDKYVFDKINAAYSGRIREKLLVIFCIKRNVNIDYISKALTLISNSNYKELLSTFEKAKLIGRPFYPFELENDKGNLVKLSDLGNKILIVDFWFTGCIGCKQLNEAMTPIVEKYKDSSEVKFLSISIDADKSKWLNSISKEEYTHPQTINLFAGGKGASTAKANRIINEYNIQSYPTIFIVKNGKMYSSNPPVPLLVDSQNLNLGNTKKLVNLIDRALKGN